MTNLNSKKAAKTLTRSLIAAVVVSAISLPVAAGKHRGNAAYDNATYDYARVVTVDPVIERYQVNEPIKQCWNEKVAVRHSDYDRPRHYKNKSRTPEIVGAIIGGVIGNRIGKRGGGNARDVATVAGAVLGGSIGRDVKHRNNRRHSGNHYESTRYKTVERCELQDSYVTKEQVVGYDVAYKYRDNVFYTQLNEHPGDKIKVKVTVNPV